MNIGIFVTSLSPRSPSQERLQRAIFSGLETAGSGNYRFLVFCYDAGALPPDDGAFSYHRVVQRRRFAETALRLRATIAKLSLAFWQLLGASGGRLHERLASLCKLEPAHFQQMRELNVRLLWNMNQHELKVPVPFVRTIWEANHRIHSMFPEYSYTRFTFDGVDNDMANSLARAAYVVTGTEVGKQEIVQMLGVYPGKVRIVPFPAPILAGIAADASQDTRRDAYVFYPARFWPHKNHVTLLEALKVLRDRYGLRMRCVFSGADEGNLGYVLKYAETLGVRDQIDYRGRVPDEELMALYRGALALVFASAVGPDNLPPLEAMALGCPVIAADVPGASEQYGDAALLFPTTSQEALAERIFALANNEELRQGLIARGLSRAAAYTVENYASRMIAIFDEFAAIARSWERCDSTFT